jgi:hypothetical protein
MCTIQQGYFLNKPTNHQQFAIDNFQSAVRLYVELCALVEVSRGKKKQQYNT